MQAVQPVKLPAVFKKTFPDTKQIILVTFGGKSIQLSPECVTIPITELHDFLYQMDEGY